MKEPIQDYLDGDLPASDLTSEELRLARQFESHGETLRVEAEALGGTDLEPAVMERITGVHEPGLPGMRQMIEWLVRPRRVSLSLRPVYAMAMALVVFVAALQLWPDSPSRDLGTVEPTQEVFVRFVVMVPEAQDVRLAGSFTDWIPSVSLRRLPNGLWTALVPVEPGVHAYAFRVDGDRWIIDPAAPRIADGFGGFNNQLSLILASS